MRAPVSSRVASLPAAMAVLLAVTAAACRQASSPLEEVARSHIEAHAPEDAVFASLLRRDLRSHFEGELHRAGLAVEFELLRSGPTQAGVALPKYYVWVRVLEGKTLLTEGAVRVAAVDKSRFDVLQYLTRHEILAEPERVALAFPAALTGRIGERARRPQQ